jgi:hypothetical protein
VAAAVGLGKARAVDVPGPAMAADRS